MPDVSKTPAYPDLYDLFARKASGRRLRAEMPLHEKLAALDRMKANAELFSEVRRKRIASQATRTSS